MCVARPGSRLASVRNYRERSGRTLLRAYAELGRSRDDASRTYALRDP
ncbi:MAG: hypothetical protein E6Q50_15220 [Lysobacter sp.]|nr:MAG: hypothetical protein E6Q50_15220 [Lysobacter sp.]